MASIHSTSPDGRMQADLQRVRQIVLEGLGSLRARVWLFGSRASAEGGRGSDIDVAILPLEPVPDGLLVRVREALDESPVLYPVDLVDLSAADPALRDHVEREGVVWRS